MPREDISDLRVCNCADCGRLLLGESMKDYWLSLDDERKEQRQLVAGRILDRPYCYDCLRVSYPGGGNVRDVMWDTDDNPSQQNAVRALEGD